MAVAEFHAFETREILATELANRVQRNLQDAEKPASLALSGGTTPKLFLKELSDLHDTLLLLVDDRWVPCNHDRSNEKLLREALDIPLECDEPTDHQHSQPQLLSLYQSNLSLEGAARLAQRRLLETSTNKLTVCVLGMGTDGHTASWFPGGDHLKMATDPDTQALYLPMTAPNAPEPRITMTLPPLAAANNLILHIEGAQKRAVFEEALGDGPADEMPIRHLLRHPHAKLQIYWAP